MSRRRRLPSPLRADPPGRGSDVSERPDSGETRPGVGGRAARLGWLAMGWICVALGIIGALLPLMPTTIFLILAAGCFARSSPRLEAWLLDHPRVGPTLRAWRRRDRPPWQDAGVRRDRRRLQHFPVDRATGPAAGDAGRGDDGGVRALYPDAPDRAGVRTTFIAGFLVPAYPAGGAAPLTGRSGPADVGSAAGQESGDAFVRFFV